MIDHPPITPEVKNWIKWHIDALNSYRIYHLKEISKLNSDPEYMKHLDKDRRNIAIEHHYAKSDCYSDMALDLDLMLYHEENPVTPLTGEEIPL